MACDEADKILREETGKVFADKVLEEDDLQPWQWLQSLLESLTSALDLPMLAIDLDGVCVCGTRAFFKARGFQTPDSSTLAYALRTGNKLTQIKGDISQCRRCPSRDICRDQANFTGPVVLGGQARFVVQFAARTGRQRRTLLMLAEQAFSVVLASAQLALGAAAAPERDGPAAAPRIEEIVGESPAIRTLKGHVLKAAQSDATVLIQGESGTGKELVANAIHAHSARAGKPFVALNCAAIPEALMESEIFGYDAGAFSGASPRGKKGLMEAAHGGTLFFDEIADMPASLQAKLLRALQERSFLRVGGKSPCRVDVRIIAAANKSLRALVEAGAFREDLYFRLNVLPIRVPPLRERAGDVRLLTGFFLNRFSSDTGRVLHITSDLLNWLEAYRWPGNIRELRNFIEYGVSFCESGVLDLDLMRHRFEEQEPGPGRPSPAPARAAPFSGALHARLAGLGRGLDAKRRLAAELGVSLATLYRRLRDERESAPGVGQPGA